MLNVTTGHVHLVWARGVREVCERPCMCGSRFPQAAAIAGLACTALSPGRLGTKDVDDPKGLQCWTGPSAMRAVQAAMAQCLSVCLQCAQHW